tara:strand:- start:300 stop:722 length:423 start_codon:yes stop_codon:yes gene_type:complete
MVNKSAFKKMLSKSKSKSKTNSKSLVGGKNKRRKGLKVKSKKSIKVNRKRLSKNVSKNKIKRNKRLRTLKKRIMRKRLSKKNNTQKGGFVGCNDVPVVNESGLSVSGHSGYNIDSLSIPEKRASIGTYDFSGCENKANHP